MKVYNHKKIEKKWQKRWAKTKIYKTLDSSKKPKYYILDMFPYPSGEGLHVGHPKGYIATDIISRMKRMQGFNILHPMGFDAFGLPAENYAIKTKTNPAVSVAKNVARYKKQLEIIGFDYDWSREVNTTDPKFYKWTEWIFLKLLEKGLAYESYEPINWCPSCKTGLANEDLENDKCERCNSEIEQKPMRQWVLRITDYAERLLQDLDFLDWPKSIKESQKNWIGKSEGAEIKFEIKNTNPSLTLPEGEGKNNYLILPGWKSGPSDHFYQWLKKELEPAKVQIVKWSGPASEEWADLVFKNYNIDENTIIVGHSLGAAVGMKVIEKLNHKVAGLITVAGFVEPKFKDHTRPFVETFKWKFDFKKIKEKTGFIKVLSDKNDYAVPFQQGKILAKELGGQLIEVTAQNPHFCADREPAIFDSLNFSSFLGRLGGVDYTHPLTPSQREGEFRYHTTDPKTWRALQDRVLEMRKNPTKAEEMLWESLRKNLTGCHFRRQHIVGRFVTDFICLEKSLVVEVDGGIHDYKKKEDEERTDFLEQNGFRVIRFHNKKILGDVGDVVNKIKDELKALPFGEGLGGVKVFTTRPDTIFGATYIVLAPEHKLINEIKSRITNWDEVEKYIQAVKKKTDIERTTVEKAKTGVELKGVKAINPATKEEIPIWIADYVLITYGTGAIMAVPAHDERDFEFAKKYNLPIKQVISHIVRPDQYAVKNGVPFENRDAVMCIVKHWEKDEYLCQEWKDFSEVRTFVSGGIEPGEDIISAGVREIKEESGYVNPKFIKQLGGFSYIEFFHKRKKINRRARFRYLYYELQDGKKVDISEEESSQHKTVWKKPNEIVNFLNIGEKERIWELFNGKEDGIFTGTGYLVNSKQFDGLDSEKAKKEIVKFVGGKMKTTYKLRDWVFSRQRYWGEPIPVLHKDGKVIPVKEKDLPVILPKVKSYEPTGTGESPLAGIDSWVNIPGGFKRETNTMPQWAGSSWYYLRYMDPNNNKALVDKNKEKYWNQVDFYVGGAEHATRHLIYARFWHKFLYDIGVVSTPEPFKKLQSVGLIMGEDGRKMSKRFSNVINPDSIVDIYGADTLRLYEMFMGPFEQVVAWSEQSIIGPHRFLERIWKIAQKIHAPDSLNFFSLRTAKPNSSLEKIQRISVISKLLHKTIKKVSEDIEEMRFNTAISSLMISLNEIEKEGISVQDFKKFLQLLAPFAPHIADELWSLLGEKKSIHISDWPIFDPKMIIDDEIKIAIQVNGKVRGEMMVNVNDNEEVVKDKAMEYTSVLKYFNGQKPQKVIYVKNRLINIVL